MEVIRLGEMEKVNDVGAVMALCLPSIRKITRVLKLQNCGNKINLPRFCSAPLLPVFNGKHNRNWLPRMDLSIYCFWQSDQSASLC